VDRAVHVGVAPLVVLASSPRSPRAASGSRRRSRGRRAGGADDALEDREIASRLLVESHAPCPRSAPCPARSAKGHAAHPRGADLRLQDGEHVADSRAARLAPGPARDQLGEDVGGGLQIAQESPTKRAAAIRPAARRSASAVRESPQSGFTSSATALAPGRSPAMPRARHRSRMTSL